MGPIQLVVFDLAGTTIEDDGAVLKCLVEAARAHDLPGTADELNALMGMNKREVFRLLVDRSMGREGDETERMVEQALTTFNDCMSSTYDRSLRPVPGAQEAFSFLRKRGIKVALDTGFEATITDMIVERLAWPGHLVDAVVCSTDVPRGRPAPYMIYRAMELLDVIDVHQVMKVGDSPADLEEGYNAGCGEVVGVLSGAHTVASLGACMHTRILQSVAELPALFV